MPNWTLSVYDLLGILVPGLIAPAMLAQTWPFASMYYSLDPWLVLALAFAIGHVVQGLSKPLAGVIARMANVLPTRPNSTQPGVAELQATIDSQLAFVYGHEFTEETLMQHRKDLCYSLVWDRLDNYKLFIALSDLHRAFGFLGLMALPISVAKLIALHIHAGVVFLDCLGAITLTVFFYRRSTWFRSLADRVVYHSFLAWVATQRIKPQSSPSSSTSS